MKSKNFTGIVLLTIIILLPSLSGCFKKGDEDPFLSIYTRKARVTGLWTVDYYNSNLKTIYGDDETQLRTIIDIKGTSWKETTTWLGTDSIREIKGKIVLDNAGQPKFTYYFDKNGIMRYIYEYETVRIGENEDIGVDTTVTTTIRHEYTGTWNFLGNIDDYKNKERIALVIEEEKYVEIETRYIVSEDDEGAGEFRSTRQARTIRYANGEMSTFWTLRMLKNKEIIMDQNIDELDVKTDINNIGTSLSVVGTKTQTLVRE
ncbi:MAG: hypothetical protein GX879_09620 [Bacteroidales bacterium]|nr:hypothetical protein [Bacteroidales bacterium]